MLMIMMKTFKILLQTHWMLIIIMIANGQIHHQLTFPQRQKEKGREINEKGKKIKTIKFTE